MDFKVKCVCPPPNRRFLTATDKDNLFTVDHFPLWYRLAVENTPGSFYYYPVNDKGREPVAMATAFFRNVSPESWRVASTGVKYVIAVTAVTVSSEGKTAMAAGESRCSGGFFWDVTYVFVSSILVIYHQLERWSTSALHIVLRSFQSPQKIRIERILGL